MGKAIALVAAALALLALASRATASREVANATTQVCKKYIGDYSQCGGPWGDCKKFPAGCAGAFPWFGACCKSPGWTCQRDSSTNNWFGCKPAPAQIESVSMLHVAAPLTIDNITAVKAFVHDKTGFEYLFFDLKTSWYQAELFCQVHYGAHLPSIHGTSEGWAINNQCFKLHHMCWTGLNDVDTEGIFTYTDGKLFDHPWWVQPHGAQAKPEDDCVALQDGMQTWDCSKQFGIVCKRKPQL